MKSMTCFAYKEIVCAIKTAHTNPIDDIETSSIGNSNEDIVISAEIKGYNSRYLDISVHLPSWLSSLESRIRKYISSRFTRGKLEVNIRVRDHNAPINVDVNEKAALIYKTAIKKLATTLGIKEDPGIGLILGLEGVLEVDTMREEEKYWKLLEPVLDAASNQAEEERVREGKHTEEDILLNIAIVEDSAKIINANVPELEETIKENIRCRFRELIGDRIDETRVLSETALLLMKYTIGEELSRLSSHLAEFRLEINRNPSPGKKLDFLSQEINREINTIGSKTPVLEVSRKVVEMKNALENIREQLRNVE